MRFNRSYRLSAEIRWLFRLKAHHRFCKHDLSELNGSSYSVHSIFREARQQYEANALFGGRVYTGGSHSHRKELVLQMGRLIVGGLSNRAVAREIGVDQETVGNFKRAVCAFTGKSFGDLVSAYGGDHA